MEKKDKKESRAVKKFRKIQAMAAEGAHESLDIESLMVSTRRGESIGGVINSYKDYDSQVAECYEKYNGKSDFGNQQLKLVVDTRTSFIAGEGLSINSENEPFNKWLAKFIKANNIFGSRFFEAVLGTEMTGKSLLTAHPVPGEYPEVIRVPYDPGDPYKIHLTNPYDPSSISDVTQRRNNIDVSLNLTNFIFIRTAGDDIHVNEATTKAGAVLNDCENYDRAVKDIRRLNHTVVRVTPTVETKNQTETNSVMKAIKEAGWKIGQLFVGTAKLSYATPGTGAHENLKTELSTTIKNISGTTGVPVHWAGWVDLTANKSTAESLYDTLGNATIRERTIISEGIYSLIVKAQELYIDFGGSDISTVSRDFTVSIPVVDFSKFLETVRALSIAYNDGVISRSDYQNQMPGINPLLTEKQLKIEQKEQQKIDEAIIKKTIIPEEEPENG